MMSCVRKHDAGLYDISKPRLTTADKYHELAIWHAATAVFTEDGEL